MALRRLPLLLAAWHTPLLLAWALPDDMWLAARDLDPFNAWPLHLNYCQADAIV